MKPTGKILVILLTIALLISFMPAPPKASAAWREPVRGKNAMVASQSELASRIGTDVMKKGGNAIDAAIAVAFALAVVYPEAGNLGGGGFMLIRFRDGKTTSIDYREIAPALTNRNVYLNGNGELIKGEGSSTVGYRASGVPGTLAGLEMAFNKYGSKKISWAQLIEPARRYAENGYVLSNRLANLMKDTKNLALYEDSKKIFLRGGNFYREGEVFRQPELAATLSRIEKSGAKEFYEGQTAKLIAADMKAHNGLITLEDLKNYQAKERAPIHGSYRGYEIISMPPPSSGGIVLLETLNILENYDLRRMGYNSSEKYHVLTEAMRRSFADRAEFMGDPDFTSVPVAQLLDKNYAKQRSKTIDSDKASKSSKIGHGEVALGRESMDTTHFTIVDTEGNVVTNTYTINDLYGSAVTAKGTGILLNDEMDDFAAQPGKPNMFGLIQGEKNSVQPRKRPLSSMTPAIVLRKDGSLWFALGARGGPRIITAVLQTIINMVDHDMNIQQAVDAPRIHHQWFPDEILYEPYGMNPDTLKILEKFGHNFAEKPGYVAQVTAIAVEEKTGVRLGAIDSRGDGEAIGY